MVEFKVSGGFLMNLLILFAFNSETICQQESSADDLYSETPCELHALSAYKDAQDNLWGIGNGSLWWFNSTNLSWSVLPLPNVTSTSESWRVICNDPQRYVVVSSLSATLILHLPWQRWHQVDTEDVANGLIDSSATWCKGGALFAADSSKSSLYVLDHEEARWTLLLEQLEPDDLNDTADVHQANDFSRTWIMSNGNFVLMSGKDSCDHILISNSSGMGWSLLKKRKDNEPWPDLNGQVVTWIQDNSGPTLWLWKSGNNASLWAFNMTDRQWEDKSKLLFLLPRMDHILTTWMNEDKLCYLKRTGECSAQYSASMTECWDGIEKNYTSMMDTLDFSTVDSTESQSEIQATSVVAKIVELETARSIFISAHSVINKHALLSALQSEEDGSDTSDDIPITAAIPARHTPWHQHTSVFGSIIFFGTSLTIFGAVGSFLCMRKCVHFPKEALLLRDPPSVRYTAIPDTIPYDTRGQTSSAYTVIPDSIA